MSRDAFDFQPDYYYFDDDTDRGIDYYQHGLQNSRGFRALKVWLGLRCAGREGYRESIREDIALARQLFDSAQVHPDLQAGSLNLSIATFRYVPAEIANDGDAVSEYLNNLNKTLLGEIQKSGQVFVSNAVVDGDYLLRACVVNFRTTSSDIDLVVKTITDIGKTLHEKMRPAYLAA